MSSIKKKGKEWHSSRSKFGMGDFYGTGLKAKVGRMRDNSMGINVVSPTKLKIPPKNLA